MTRQGNLVANGDYLGYFGAAHAEELWQAWYTEHLWTMPQPQFEHPELYDLWLLSFLSLVLTTLMLEAEDDRLTEQDEAFSRIQEIAQERLELEERLRQIGDERV